MKANRQAIRGRVSFVRTAAGVFCGLAIALSVSTSAGAQSYVPGGDIPLAPTTAPSTTPKAVELGTTTTTAPAPTPAPAPAVANDPAAGVEAQATATTTTTTTAPKTAQVKGVTLQAIDPAFTGANTVPVVAIGVLALGAGTVLLVAARKRRTN